MPMSMNLSIKNPAPHVSIRQGRTLLFHPIYYPMACPEITHPGPSGEGKITDSAGQWLFQAFYAPCANHCANCISKQQ